MGKKRQYAIFKPYNYVPRISEASKKIALQRLKRVDTKGVPHFMLETKSKINACESLSLVPISNVDLSTVSKETWADLRKVVPHIGQKGVKMGDVDINKNAGGSSGGTVLDQTVFTFRPKVSSASVKIAESLGTDFMSRQQKHLEKQKKLWEESNLRISFNSSPGHLSPINHTKKVGRKSQQEIGDQENNAESPSSAGQLDAGSQDEEMNEINPEMCASNTIPLSRTRTHISPGLQRIMDGPYGQGNPEMVMKHKRGFLSPSTKHNASIESNTDNKENDVIEKLSRSKTMPSLGRPKLNRRIIIPDGERLRNAKDIAEKAIRLKKVFTIQGGYSTIRQSLRRRGWVEKFYKIPVPTKFGPKRKKRKSSDDSDDDDDDSDDDDDDDDDDIDGDDHDEPKIPPWEEDDGIYGIMSRMVRNVNPTFFWVLKRDAVDYRFLGKDQIVNHYCKAGSFTTKVGLCINLKNVPWFEPADPDTFFPRCYRLSSDEDKNVFIDDFRLSACMNILNIVTNKNQSIDDTISIQSVTDLTASTENQSTENNTSSETNPSTDKSSDEPEQKEGAKSERQQLTDTPKVSKKFKKKTFVPLRVLEQAMRQCNLYLASREHDDIDRPDDFGLSESNWDQLIQYYYQLAHEGGIIPSIPPSLLCQCESLINRLKSKFPQYEMDGTRNVWIVKPGAKSRGRGIMCYNKLEDMLKLVNSQVCQKDGKYVVQKYIERPLLVYNTKFDIRQWFLVTDWSPLTMYFYTDSYLRFCSQQYTLDDFDEAIHLSNNAIQKNKKNGPRSTKLPADNMWTHDDFKVFLSKRKQGHVWDKIIYPGMKKALICSLLVTQDLIEYRKSSFELYGADFMLTEDYHPWLIEINSSPSMEASTAITSRLCSNVLEDTIKVVVDRKSDRNCDIGRFELAYKQPFVAAPPYIGTNLSLEGQALRKTGTSKRSELSFSQASEAYFTPRTNIRQSVSLEKVSESKKASVSTSSAGAVMKGSVNEGGGKVVKKSHSNSKFIDTLSEEHSPYEKPRVQMPFQKIFMGESKKSDTSDTNTTGTSSTIPLVKHTLHPPLQPKLSNHPPSLSVTSSRRIVSRTSVSSNNYKIPTSSTDKSKPLVTVNNVESTDLKTIKATGGTKGNGGGIFQPSHKIKRKSRRSIVKRDKSRTHVTIRFPPVPYANVNVAFSPVNSHTAPPKLKYFSQPGPHDELYRPTLPLSGGVESS